MFKGFTVENWKRRLVLMPREDWFDVSEDGRIAVVADGVTRDGREYLPNLDTITGKIGTALIYPRRKNPARVVARNFCCSVIDEMENADSKDRAAVRTSLYRANIGILLDNAQLVPNPDYVVNDLGGCVGAVATLDKNFVHWGFICDCGAALFNKKGELKEKTPDEGPSVHHNFIWQDERLKDRRWGEPEARRIVRCNYRNKPGCEHSFGVLTGEPSAMNYVRTGTWKRDEGDITAVYTDGVGKILFDEDGDVNGSAAVLIRDRDYHWLKKLCQQRVHSEGTLVVDF